MSPEVSDLKFVFFKRDKEIAIINDIELTSYRIAIQIELAQKNIVSAL